MLLALTTSIAIVKNKCFTVVKYSGVRLKRVSCYELRYVFIFLYLAYVPGQENCVGEEVH